MRYVASYSLALLAFALVGCASTEERVAARAADASFTETATRDASPDVLAECLKAAQDSMKNATYEQKGPLKPSASATRWIEKHPGFLDDRPKPTRGGRRVVFIAPVEAKNLIGLTLHSYMGCSFESADNKLFLLQGLNTGDFTEINSIGTRFFHG